MTGTEGLRAHIDEVVTWESGLVSAACDEDSSGASDRTLWPFGIRIGTEFRFFFRTLEPEFGGHMS